MEVGLGLISNILGITHENYHVSHSKMNGEIPLSYRYRVQQVKEGVWFGFATLMSHPMHLTRAEVAKLLPYRQKFVETGDFESAQL